ncbi:MAG: N-acetylmuramic acid 6-phosphate etherase [Clostridia bacterium]|nr:N-acetylmuramic acid 6-phosphate etherase [Clostridia bacterium]
MLKTEMRNSKTTHIDTMTTEEMVAVIQEENLHAVQAVGAVQADIVKVIDAAAQRMQQGGRLFYVGCGTSGRLGVLDASECPPTFGVSKGVVIGIIAGGDGALRNAVEGAEDSFEAGYADLKKYDLNETDTVIGISAAGGAGYVLGAFALAKECGTLTAAITSNPVCKLVESAALSICPDTGAEVVTGSTRMKAGTAQKLILNMISTSVMIKLGHVYENLMINLRPSNIKLRNRMISIVSDITGVEHEKAEQLLSENDFNIRKAVEAYNNK